MSSRSERPNAPPSATSKANKQQQKQQPQDAAEGGGREAAQARLDKEAVGEVVGEFLELCERARGQQGSGAGAAWERELVTAVEGE